MRVGMEGDLRPAEKWFGLYGLRVICLAPSLQMSLMTFCAAAGLARQTVSVKAGLRTQLGVEGGLMMKKSPRKPHDRAAVPAGLSPFSSLPQPCYHLPQESPAVEHGQAKQMGRRCKPGHHHLGTSALTEPSLVAGLRSLPSSETSSVRRQQHDHPQMHQQPALLQEWSDPPMMKGCVHTFAMSLHGNEDTRIR